MKITKDDIVSVISGNWRGAGPVKITSVNRELGQVTVESINTRVRHIKRGNPKSPHGGRISVTLPIPYSKVLLFCKTCNKGRRQSISIQNGQKLRFCRSCRSQF